MTGLTVAKREESLTRTESVVRWSRNGWAACEAERQALQFDLFFLTGARCSNQAESYYMRQYKFAAAIFHDTCSKGTWHLQYSVVIVSLLLFFAHTPNARMLLLLFLTDVVANESFLLFGRFSKPDQSLKFPYLRPTLY